MGRNIDIVYALDATGSMGGCMANVKNNLNKINAEIYNQLTDDAGNSQIDLLRVKFVIFRDYKSEGSAAITESRFFERPDDDKDMQDYINAVDAYGGDDGPENGLEAMYYAMKSDFNSSNGRKDRQVIILITDNDAHELGARAACAGYPSEMVDFDGLKGMWSGADQSVSFGEKSKRMLIFAPAGTKYEEFAKVCTRVQFTETDLGDGLNGIDFAEVMRAIVATATA